MKIRSFLTVAKTGNFTVAGNILYISQQAVSKNVSDLERDTGILLFRRDHHSVSLTEEGEKFREFFDGVSRDYGELLKEIHAQAPDRSAQDIRIGYQDMIDFGSAPVGAFKRLRQKWPGVMLIGEHIKPDELLKKLDSGALDVILINRRFLPPRKAGFRVLPLFQTAMVVGAAADHPLIREGTAWRSFRKEPLLIDAVAGEAEDAAIRRVSVEIRKFGFKPQTIIVLPNRETIYSEAELGRGVFFASGIALIPNLTRLKIYPTDVEEETCCVWKETGGKGQTSQYIKYLREEYAKDHRV